MCQQWFHLRYCYRARSDRVETFYKVRRYRVETCYNISKFYNSAETGADGRASGKGVVWPEEESMKGP